MQFESYIVNTINQFIEELAELIVTGHIIDAIKDTNIYQEKTVIGTQFQLAFLSQLLWFLSQYESLSLIHLNMIRSHLNQMVSDRFLCSGFSYTEYPNSFPTDLDTLAATVSVLDRSSDCVDSANTLLNLCWKQDGFPTVFLAENEHTARRYGEIFHCGDRLWHFDVIINCLIAKELNPKLILGFTIDSILNYIPINYWYIPSTFSYFRLSQLTKLKCVNLPKYSLTELNNISSVSKMRQVFLTRNCSGLENALHAAATGSISPAIAAKCIDIAKSDDPVLYPTIGFKPFRSQLLYKCLLMVAVAQSLTNDRVLS
jgi:hypothetical protein